MSSNTTTTKASSSSAAGTSSEASSSGTSTATSPPASAATSWYGGAPSPYPGYPPSPQQAGAYPGYAQWQSYPGYPGYGNYAGWDYNSGSGVPPSPGSASNPLPTPPPPPPSSSSKSSKDGTSSKSSSSKLPQPPPLPPLPPPAFALPPPPPPGQPPAPSVASSTAEPPKKEKESREERKKRKKEKKKKEREEREREKERRARHDKEREKTSASVDGVPTVKSYATILKESCSSKDKERSDSKSNKTSSNSKESSAAEVGTDAGNVLFPPPDFSRPPPPPPPLPAQDAKQEGGKDATPGGHPPLQPPPLPPQSALGGGAPYNAFDLNVPPPGFPPSPGFPPPKHGYPPMGPLGGPPGTPSGPPGLYGYTPNWYSNSNTPRGPPGPDDLRGGNDAGPYGPGGPYHHPRDGSQSPYGNSKPGSDGGNNSHHPPHHGQSPFEPHHVGGGPGSSGPGHIKFNFQQKNNFNKQNALLETPPTKPQWNPNRPLGSAGSGPDRGDFRGGLFRDGPMDMEQGRDGPRGPNRRNMNNWRDDPQAEGPGMGRGGPGMGRGGPGMGRDGPGMDMEGPGMGRGAAGIGGRGEGPPVRPEESLFGSTLGKVPSKDSLAKGGSQSNLSKQQQSQKDMVSMMKGDWPDTLKRYVERCFAKCVTDLDKDQVEIVLKGKLTAAAKTGSLWTHNWDTEAVPSVHSDSMFKSIRNRFPTRGSDETKEKESPEKRPNDFGRGGGNMSRGGGTAMGRGGSSNDSTRGSEGRDGDKRGGRHHGGRSSRSRSRSPYSSSRHRRDNRRRYSRSPSEDIRGPSISGNSNNSNFLPVGGGGGGPNNFRGQKRGRGGRGGSISSRLGQMGNNSKEGELGGSKDKENAPGTNAYGGPNEDFFDLTTPPKQPNKKMKMDGSGKEKDPRNDIYFYSKGGKMTLDADLATDAHLQKRADRFKSMMGGGGATAAAAAPAPTPSPRGGRGGRGGQQQAGKRGRGRGRGAAAAAASAAAASTPSIVSTINASLFSVDTGDMDWAAMHVVGTCTEVKKQYLRLTSAPDPGTVRTLATLYKSLEFVKKDWIEKKDYRYTCNQMKSIRQDLTVQGIRDNFTIQVYEAHCRVALETADHEEFNQCQSQLKQLYSELPGAPNSLEFTAYRLLYYIYTKNTLDMTSLMAELTTKHKSDECIAFALNLRAAWAMSNYCKFFKLFLQAPKMAGYLVDWFTERERKIAIKIMVKGYRPGSVSTEFVKSQLAVTADEWAKLAEAVGLQYTDRTRTCIDCKTTVLAA